MVFRVLIFNALRASYISTPPRIYKRRERVLAPLRTSGPPIVDMIRPMSVLEAIRLTDFLNPPGLYYLYRAEALHTLSDELFETIISHIAAPNPPFLSAVLYHIHGAATRIASDETAFASRREHYILEMIMKWAQGGRQPQIDQAQRFWAAIAPFASEGLYVNFLAEESEARVRASYGPNYERLLNIKHTYDPLNFFHLNQNIKPVVK